MRTQDPIVFGSPFRVATRDRSPGGLGRCQPDGWRERSLARPCSWPARFSPPFFGCENPANPRAQSGRARGGLYPNLRHRDPARGSIACARAPPPGHHADVAVSVTAPVGPKTEIPPVTALPIVTTPHPESAPLPAALTSVPPPARFKLPRWPARRSVPAAPPALAAGRCAGPGVRRRHGTSPAFAPRAATQGLMTTRYRLNDIVERAAGPAPYRRRRRRAVLHRREWCDLYAQLLTRLPPERRALRPCSPKPATFAPVCCRSPTACCS